MSSEEEKRETKESKEAARGGKESSEEDLWILDPSFVLSPPKVVEVEDRTRDLTTKESSRLADLEDKRERAMLEFEKTKNLARSKERLEPGVHIPNEETARKNCDISSLKKRIEELEKQVECLYAVHGTNEINLQGLQRDFEYQYEKMREYRKKLGELEQTVSKCEEQAHSSSQDFVRKLANALSMEYRETVHSSPEVAIHEVEELVRETNRLRARNTNIEAQLATVEVDFRNCRDTLDRMTAEREQLQRQVSSQLIELDRWKQDKECLEMRYRVAERELNGLRDKLANANRSISNATGNISNREALIGQLREDLKQREEKCQRAQTELRHFLESLAILVNGPNRYIESHENAIKDRIREILAENKDQALTVQNLRDKVNAITESANRQSELIESTVAKIRNLEEERFDAEGKVRKLEAEVADCELSKESLRRDKQTLVTFLERLGKAMQMEEISDETGLELQTESLVARAEQLARLETDKLADKTSVVYQLQRRVRTLREQLQRRDLHLDLLRRKLSLQEESVKTKSFLQSERDDANVRARKLSKQIDRLQILLSEERTRNRELSAQLTETADYKIAALERSRKIEELQKRLVESEMLRTRCGRKLSTLKEEMRSTTESAEQERSISDHSLQLLREELTQAKQNLSDLTKRESQLQSFRVSVVKLLSEPICSPDYEIISRLQKIVAAHRDFTMLSRRYDESLDISPSRCTSIQHAMHPPRSPSSRCARYEDSGFADPPDLRDIEDESNTRPVRSSLLP